MEIKLRAKQLAQLSEIQAKKAAISKEIASLNKDEALIVELAFEEAGYADLTKIAKVELNNGSLVFELVEEKKPKANKAPKKAQMKVE